MGIKYLWDTNIAIYYLQQQLPPNGESFIDDLLKAEQPVLSTITEIELLCWKTATEKDLKLLANFIAEAFVIELEQAIKLRAADIRKTNNLKLPDAIIAATALEYGLILITRNTNDFRNITGLNLLNLWKI